MYLGRSQSPDALDVRREKMAFRRDRALENLRERASEGRGEIRPPLSKPLKIHFACRKAGK